MRSFIILSITPILACTSLLSQETYHFGFEDVPAASACPLHMWSRNGCRANWDDGLDDRSFIDSTLSFTGKKSLRIAYPKDSVGPSGNGAQIDIILPPAPEYYLSYSLRFSDDFSYRLGGKLPGLAGGKLCSGGQTCDGTNGFTARFMWRRNGLIVLYLYHMDKKGEWGDDIPLVYPGGKQVAFETGKWYRIRERVKINSTPESHDGEVEAWVDGLPVLKVGGLRFVSNGDWVDRFYFSTFHGGNSPDWAPDHTCYVNFDDLSVSASENDLK